MRYKILDTKWRSALHTVGFVAYDCQNPVEPGQWNSVVGYLPGAILFSEEIAEQYIAANGAKLEWQLAEILFPQLDITKHKYYTPPHETASDVSSS